jgi:hypothetical protein
MVEKTILDFALGFAGGIVADKVAEYLYVSSGAYEAAGRISWDDFALNMTGIGLAAYRKNIGLGFLTGVWTGWLLSVFGIVIPTSAAPKASSAGKTRRVKLEELKAK